MIVVYGRLEGSPPRVTAVTQMTSMADRWYSGMQLRGRLGFDEPAHQDVLIVEFPDNRQEEAVEFLAWMHYQPKLFEVTGLLAQDGLVWKMWSVENDPKNIMRTEYRENYHHIYEGAEAALNYGKNPCGDPNLRMEFIGRRGFYVARRPIKKGEELTIDYSFEFSKDPLKCLSHVSFPFNQGMVDEMRKRLVGKRVKSVELLGDNSVNITTEDHDT